jgi:hypothetical protein
MSVHQIKGLNPRDKPCILKTASGVGHSILRL